MFGLIMGGLARAATSHAATFGSERDRLAYELANLHILDWWYFPTSACALRATPPSCSR